MADENNQEVQAGAEGAPMDAPQRGPRGGRGL